MRKNKPGRVFSYLKPYKVLLIISLVLALLINISELINPYITKVVIDEYIVKKNFHIQVELLGLIYIATVILCSVLNFIQSMLLNSMGQGIIHDIRMSLFSHVQNMPLSFFDKNSSGRILTRITNDVEAVNELYSTVIITLFKSIFMLLGIIIVMLQMNIKLALVTFTVIPIIILVTYFYKNKVRKNFIRVRNLISQINSFFAENISGMKLVQIFNRQNEKLQEFRVLNKEYNKACIMEVTLFALFKPASELINSLAISLIIWYSCGKVFNNIIEIGVLFAFITYVKKFFVPISDLADMYNTIQSGFVSADRIFEILDNNEGLENPREGLAVKRTSGKIEFKNVWFSYNNTDWILKDISFIINPGETVAFVGATGSGKSTIINLIGRFYEIQKGEILLDGTNIKDIKLEDLRRNIAVVMQDVFLFSGDIKSNIRLNNIGISEDTIITAARYVNADSFIEMLPNRYSEEVRERGCTLSSGEKQLLSFARAIAFNPPIIVLDEATSNIDTDTEKIIQASLAKVSQNRTTLVIAHRLSTIKNADKIIVIHKGRIKETGVHHELLKKNGIYKSLYEIQSI